jgi:hypothetical protein
MTYFSASASSITAILRVESDSLCWLRRLAFICPLIPKNKKVKARRGPWADWPQSRTVVTDVGRGQSGKRAHILCARLKQVGYARDRKLLALVCIQRVHISERNGKWRASIHTRVWELENRWVLQQNLRAHPKIRKQKQLDQFCLSKSIQVPGPCSDACSCHQRVVRRTRTLSLGYTVKWAEQNLAYGTLQLPSIHERLLFPGNWTGPPPWSQRELCRDGPQPPTRKEGENSSQEPTGDLCQNGSAMYTTIGRMGQNYKPKIHWVLPTHPLYPKSYGRPSCLILFDPHNNTALCWRNRPRAQGQAFCSRSHSKLTAGLRFAKRSGGTEPRFFLLFTKPCDCVCSK